ncbi:MAG: hypothetical protein JXA82_12590 [Sedimentisphaerales bacterium]|nr:hypothetical protein [Sedimentisphaerales bacterium]
MILRTLNMRFPAFLIIYCVLSAIVFADITVTYTIDTGQDRAPISPYIYGSNSSMTGSENLAARRSGGNRLTGYNWENNYSNAGSDWYHHSDQYLVRNFPSSQKLIPGIVLTNFHDSCLAANQLSVITLQMAGYVSADDNGTVEESETAPSNRWKQAVFRKSGPFCDPPGSPDTTDGSVNMDECVCFLVSRYGNASTATGVKYYALDNEPALWTSTHPRIHPDKLGCAELIDRSTGLSTAIKDIDPDAMVGGPVLYGFNAFMSLQGAPDWASVENGYNWFLDYYLDQMQQASATEGRRLLDVLDLHWYSEARGDGQRITDSAETYSQANATARMQAPRTLWDPDYVEDSWIGTWFRKYLPLLPNVLDSIDTYYPDTKLAITEFSYGAADHISGGIAMADVLGIFGKYGLFLSTYWHLGGDYDYVSAAYKIYRNYDGADSTFGDTRIYASMSDKVNSSIYGSMFTGRDSEMHLILLNKNFDEPINGIFNITSNRTFTSARVWAFDADSSQITEIAPAGSINGNTFFYTIPPLTVCHMVVTSDCPLGDLSGDCDVDSEDLELFIDQWLDTGECLESTCADLNNSRRVDLVDLALLGENWTP